MHGFIIYETNGKVKVLNQCLNECYQWDTDTSVMTVIKQYTPPDSTPIMFYYSQVVQTMIASGFVDFTLSQSQHATSASYKHLC